MKILFTNEEIIKMCETLGQEITKDYERTNPIVACVLKGAKPFHTELIKHIKTDFETDALRVKSYEGTHSKGHIDFLQHMELDVKDRNIILVEDIIDSGITMSELVPYLEKKGALSVRVATLLDKQCNRKVNFEADYVGAVIPNHFVIGFGLDFNENFRELPFIGIYDESANEYLRATEKE